MDLPSWPLRADWIPELSTMVRMGLPVKERKISPRAWHVFGMTPDCAAAWESLLEIPCPRVSRELG
jgi:hypothetical protein